jgi:hypothetical protein
MNKVMMFVFGVLLMFTSSCVQQETIDCSVASDLDACYLEKAILDKNLDECDNIESVESKDSCYAAMAEVGNNIEVCHTISDESISMLCYTNLAMKNSDSSICDEIVDTQGREDCLSLF